MNACSDACNKPTGIQDSLGVEFFFDGFHQAFVPTDRTPCLHLLPDGQRRFLNEERAAELLGYRAATIDDANCEIIFTLAGGSNDSAAEVRRNAAVSFIHQIFISGGGRRKRHTESHRAPPFFIKITYLIPERRLIRAAHRCPGVVVAAHAPYPL